MIIKNIHTSPLKLTKIVKNIRNPRKPVAIHSKKPILMILKQTIDNFFFKFAKKKNYHMTRKFKKYSDFLKNFFVKEIFINRGSILKRIQPRAKGKAYRIEKKFSHITISLSILENLKDLVNNIKNLGIFQEIAWKIVVFFLCIQIFNLISITERTTEEIIFFFRLYVLKRKRILKILFLLLYIFFFEEFRLKIWDKIHIQKVFD